MLLHVLVTLFPVTLLLCSESAVINSADIHMEVRACVRACVCVSMCACTCVRVKMAVACTLYNGIGTYVKFFHT